jgi:hypothetical protein
MRQRRIDWYSTVKGAEGLTTSALIAAVGEIMADMARAQDMGDSDDVEFYREELGIYRAELDGRVPA